VGLPSNGFDDGIFNAQGCEGKECTEPEDLRQKPSGNTAISRTSMSLLAFNIGQIEIKHDHLARIRVFKRSSQTKQQPDLVHTTSLTTSQSTPAPALTRPSLHLSRSRLLQH